VDALLDMVSEYNLSWKDVVAITCEVTPLVSMSLVYTSPATPDEARFSMPFCIASALKEKRLLPSQFTRDNIKEAVIRKLMEKVTMVIAPNNSVGKEGFSLDGPEAARVIIRTKDEKILSKTVQHAKGGTQNPLSWDEIYDKFCRCTESIIPDQKSDQIKKAVFGIESFTHASELVGLLEMKS
jgi:2-methylcitrate dehydratase PrpD